MNKGMTILMLLLLGLQGCSLVKTPYSIKNPVIHEEVVKGGDGATVESRTMLKETAARWIEAYGNARTAADPQIRKFAIYNFVDAGITYSGLLCEEYFLAMKYTHAHRGFYQKEVSLMSGMTSALMGLAQASAGSIAATGAAFSFGNASFDSYNEAFVFSADLNALESLVRASQAQQEVIILKKLNASDEKPPPDSIRTLDQAVRELDKYTYTCTRGGIVALLNDTVTDNMAAVRNTTKLKTESQAPASVLENTPSNATQVPGAPNAAAPAAN